MCAANEMNEWQGKEGGKRRKKINLENGHKLGYGIKALHIRFPGREWVCVTHRIASHTRTPGCIHTSLTGSQMRDERYISIKWSPWSLLPSLTIHQADCLLSLCSESGYRYQRSGDQGWKSGRVRDCSGRDASQSMYHS